MERNLQQSLTRRLPWAVTAAVTVGFVAAWPKPEPVSSPGATVSSAPASAAPPAQSASATAEVSPLKLLDVCTRQLRRRRAAASAPRDTRADGGIESAPLPFERCLEDPRFAEACEAVCANIPAAGAPPVGDDFAGKLARAVVGIPDEDVAWLQGYLCRVHRLRENLVLDLHDALAGDEPAGPDVIEQLVADAQDARSAALEDIAARLGDERYARLRSIGGVNMLGAALDCPD